MLTDPAGDSQAGQVMDFTELYTAKDDNYLYIMLKAGKKPTNEWAVDLFIDIKEGGQCGQADKIIEIWSAYPDAFSTNTPNGCGYGDDTKRYSGLFKWGDVLEIKIPLLYVGDCATLNITQATSLVHEDDWWATPDIIGINESLSTPFMNITTNSLPINFDGDYDDWIDYTPVLTDMEGDSTKGSNTDLVSAYQLVDSEFLYLMIKTKDPIITSESEIDIWIDLDNSGKCDPAEKGFSIHSNLWTVGIWDFITCQITDWREITGSFVVWKDVVEILMPLSSLGDYDHISITHISLNVPTEGIWGSEDGIVR